MKKFAAWFIITLEGLLLSGCVFSEAGSVGVIGGADGPTAVFVASKFSPMSVLIPAVLLAVIAAAGVIAYLLHRRKK